MVRSPSYPPQQQSALDRLQAMPLGAPENRLRVGALQIAFVDKVLLIELDGGSLTLLHTDVSPQELRVVLGERRLLVDLWPQSASTVSLQATPEELQAAEAYFRERGVLITTA